MANVPSETAVAANSANVARLLRLSVVLLTPLSLGNFSPEIINPQLASLQQLLTLGLWLAVIALSYLAPTRGRLVAGTDTYFAVAFYCIAIGSIGWSNYSAESYGKAAALLITTFAAYRLTRLLTITEIIDSVMIGLFCVAVASLLVVVVAPDIGVVHTWMHDGLWSGVFESKQSLGISAALLVFLALQRFSLQRSYFPLIAGLTGALCVFGSGSRGAFVVAGAAATCSWLVQRSSRFMTLMTMVPLLIAGIATCLIVYMLESPVPYFDVFGTDVDFTERSFIWHYALSRLPEHPFLGFGLNGFWTDEFTLADFTRQHGWVLDNYHSGFVTILMETGVIGYGAFVLCYFFNALRLVNPHPGALLANQERALVLSLTSLIFLIDLTETYFLRSTNVVATLLAMMLFAAGSVRTDTAR